jgi:hypothetical protein
MRATELLERQRRAVEQHFARALGGDDEAQDPTRDELR